VSLLGRFLDVYWGFGGLFSFAQYVKDSGLP
jgi:hypothetical protein